MRYFDYFNLIPYTIQMSDGSYSTFYVKNIFERVKMLDPVVTNITSYYQYDMKDGDTLENIAYRYYGDVNKYWIIIFTNRILDPFYDVPLKYEQFLSYITDKYGSVANAESIIDHYEKQITKKLTNTANGYYSSETTVTYYANTTYSIDGSTTFPTIANPVLPISGPSPITIDHNLTLSETINLVAVNAYDTENTLNESRRHINLIKKEYALTIENELQKLLTQ